ncbi:MAG: HlyD family secretion protein [Bythopirellula sp.]
MKSRLLPQPMVDYDEVDVAAPVPEYSRRESDVAEVKTAAPAVESTPQPQPNSEPVATVARSAPQVSARPTGRYAVVGILLVCVLSICSLVWTTFLRDKAYGMVSGTITEISPPWSGTLTAVYARVGDTVRQGDVLAVVDDPELRGTIDRLHDELRTAQAELDSQVALLAVAARQQSNHTEELRVRYYDLRGELLAEQSRYDELSSKLQRRRLLAKRKAISDEEIESLDFEVQGLAAKTENLSLAVETLAARLETLTDPDAERNQLKPWLAKIENFQAEIRRLRDKLHRGTIRAPLSGKVIDVAAHVGQRATPQQHLLELLPDGSLELVLYVQQDDVSDYQINQQLELIVEPDAQSVRCQVVRLGQRFEQPKAHVAGRYGPNEQLLPIYLKPTVELAAGANLRIGSAVRLPVRLFGSSH